MCHAAYRSDFARCPSDGGALAIATRDPLVGDVLADRYEIEALIGQGAMGRIYRARHTLLADKRYAVKVLLGDFATSLAMRMRFANEAKNASRLDHRNIVRVVDFGRTDTGLLYLVMELVEGMSLGALVRAGLLGRERAVAILRQLCEGLDHAHGHGVVHRDFKPDNILVVGDTPRIVDFGLAISTSAGDPRLTTSGVLCTPAYAAPEQLTGGALDHRVDLYALGVTMFEMLTGRLPFSGDTGEMMACKLARAQPVIPSAVPPPLARIILRLLAADPNRRFHSARGVLDALDRVHDAPGVRAHRSIFATAAIVAVATTPWQFATRAPTAVADRSPRRPQVADPARVSVAAAVEMPSDAVRAPPRRVALAAPHRRIAAAAAVLDAKPRAVVSRADDELDPAVAKPASVAALRAPLGRTDIVGLDIAGPLPDSVIRRAIERVHPDLRSCAGRAGVGAVSAQFTIGETRRASDLVVTPLGDPRATCIIGVLAGVRTETAPDVGDAHVVLRIAF